MVNYQLYYLSYKIVFLLLLSIVYKYFFNIISCHSKNISFIKYINANKCDGD